MIAGMYLFDELKSDSVLLSSDTAYQSFVSDKEEESIGFLYQTKTELKTFGEPDSELSESIAETDSLIKLYIDTIHYLDSMNLANPDTNYLTEREAFIEELSELRQTKIDLLQEQQDIDSDKMTVAETKNNLVVPSDIPDANEKFINAIEIKFKRRESLNNIFEQILEVAMQCPYSGGHAVYRARVLAEHILNASIEYDNENVCFQEGIYKQAGQTDKPALNENDILIVPNPANDKAEIVLKGDYEGLCEIEINDVIGKTVFAESFDCKNKKHNIHTGSYLPGIYQIKVLVNGEFIKLAKLIIAR